MSLFFCLNYYHSSFFTPFSFFLLNHYPSLYVLTSLSLSLCPLSNETKYRPLITPNGRFDTRCSAGHNNQHLDLAVHPFRPNGQPRKQQRSNGNQWREKGRSLVNCSSGHRIRLHSRTGCRSVLSPGEAKEAAHAEYARQREHGTPRPSGRYQETATGRRQSDLGDLGSCGYSTRIRIIVWYRRRRRVQTRVTTIVCHLTTGTSHVDRSTDDTIGSPTFKSRVPGDGG